MKFQKKVRAFWKSTDQKFWDLKSRKCSSKCSLKIVWKWKSLIFLSRKFSFSYNFQWKFRWFFDFFRSQNFWLPISKCFFFFKFFPNKPFWSRFFQICVDFHGGHDGTDFRSICEAQCALKHFWYPLNFCYPLVTPVQKLLRIHELPRQAGTGFLGFHKKCGQQIENADSERNRW